MLFMLKCDIQNYTDILRYTNITPTNRGLLVHHTWYVLTIKIPHLQTEDCLNITPNIFKLSKHHTN